MTFWKKLFGASSSKTTTRAVVNDMFQAFREGDLGTITAMLKGNPDLVFCKDDNGYTPLHMAAQYGHKDLAKWLLTRKAEVNAKSNENATPLHAAAAGGYKDLAELLLANKADVNAKATNDLTPLGLAKMQWEKDMVELLCQHGGHE